MGRAAPPHVRDRRARVSDLPGPHEAHRLADRAEQHPLPRRARPGHRRPVALRRSRGPPIGKASCCAEGAWRGRGNPEETTPRTGRLATRTCALPRRAQHMPVLARRAPRGAASGTPRQFPALPEASSASEAARRRLLYLRSAPRLRSCQVQARLPAIVSPMAARRRPKGSRQQLVATRRSCWRLRRDVLRRPSASRRLSVHFCERVRNELTLSPGSPI